MDKLFADGQSILKEEEDIFQFACYGYMWEYNENRLK